MGFSPLDLRYYFLSVHYRTNLKFTKKGLDDAHKARRKIVEWISEINSAVPTSEVSSGHMMDEQIEIFKKAINEDLNTPAALADVFAVMNYYYANTNVDQATLDKYIEFVEMVRDTFGCFEPEETEEIPAEIKKLLDQRQKARDEKDFEASDKLRDQIRDLGWEVRDEEGGQEVRKT